MTDLTGSVLRLATTPFPRDQRSAELSRIFGGPVEVAVVVHVEDPDTVKQLVHKSGARAVLADVYRADLEELRRCIAPVPVLRPVFAPRPGAHAGPRIEQFVAYAMLRADGQLATIIDGALAT